MFVQDQGEKHFHYWEHSRDIQAELSSWLCLHAV